MRKINGFTLMELLIVIGILTILAGIAIPNYMNAQTRAKIARAHADMRTLSSALEAYRVDTNTYPAACQNGTDSDKDRLGGQEHAIRQHDSNGIVINCYLNNNDAVIMATSSVRETAASWRSAFSVDPGFRSLTTPAAYISAYPSDPFADTQGLSYGYANIENMGWMLWSFGPDVDESDGGEVGEAHSNSRRGCVSLNPAAAMNKHSGTNSWNWAAYCADSDLLAPLFPLVYHPELHNSTTLLETAGYTYDATNGSVSSGGPLAREVVTFIP